MQISFSPEIIITGKRDSWVYQKCWIRLIKKLIYFKMQQMKPKKYH